MAHLARPVLDGGVQLEITQVQKQELQNLITSYRNGSSDLAHLSQRIEILIEAMQSTLPISTFSKAMNCVYLIEDINALVLDEKRPITEVEQHEIHAKLLLIESHLLLNK
jgi:hypothetical protein